jgi:hypothetical protein
VTESPWPKCEWATEPRDFHITGRLKVVRGCRLIAAILSEGADTIPKGFENFLSPAMCASCPYLAVEARVAELEGVGRFLLSRLHILANGLDLLEDYLRRGYRGQSNALEDAWNAYRDAVAAARDLGLDQPEVKT